MRALLAVLLFALPAFGNGRQPPTWRVDLGASGLLAATGNSANFAAGITFGGYRRVSAESKLAIGFEAGVFAGWDYSSLAKAFFNALVLQSSEIIGFRLVPVLPGFLIRGWEGRVHPYGGLSVGPAFASYSVVQVGSGSGETPQSHVYWMATARGGVDVDLYDGWGISVEPLRVGTVLNSFYWGANIEAVGAF